MRADEWLLEHAAEPTLRLYGWDGPWLSLGYAQPDNWLDHSLLQQWGVSLVRRPTGGQAVLHQRELTYSVVLPQAPPGGVRLAFGEILGWFAQALTGLGWPVETGAGSDTHHPKPSCYDRIQGGEIGLQGKKLIGSAGLRRGRRLLQHGSLPVEPDLELFRRVFPGAELPATLPGLTAHQLVSRFPVPLQRRDWSDAERSALCLH